MPFTDIYKNFQKQFLKNKNYKYKSKVVVTSQRRSWEMDWKETHRICSANVFLKLGSRFTGTQLIVQL